MHPGLNKIWEKNAGKAVFFTICGDSVNSNLVNGQNDMDKKE